MAARRNYHRRVSRTRIGEQHLTWLQALPGDGPFLTIPVLTEAFPAGLEPTRPERAAAFKHAYATYRTTPTAEQPTARDTFITATVRDVLDWGRHSDASEPTTTRFTHTISAFNATTTPAFTLWPDNPDDIENLDQTDPNVLGFVWPPDVPLNRRMLDGWAATPIDRAAAALRHHNIPLGIVTNTRTWVIVWAPRGSATGWVLFDTHAMLDDRELLDAFTSLLSRRRQLAVADTDTLPALLNRSLDSQEELTENLSVEVRQAVEMLVDAIGRADRETGGLALAGVDADHVYQGAVTIVMRLVFVLAAEERLLLPGDDDLWISNYGIAGLADRLIQAANISGEDVLARQAEAFPQILAASRIVHDGVRHQTLNVRGYGGSVFDPDRHPWLEGRQPGGPGKPVHVDDRTMLHILRGLTRWQGRRLAYRTLDVEQIGYVYEGLLDHTAVKADTVYLGLAGKHEPEVRLDDLETQAARGDTQLVKWLKDVTGLSAAQVTRGLANNNPDGEQERLLLAACGNDPQLAQRARPYVGLIRKDERTGQPIIFLPGDWFVTKSDARSGSGAYYTPRSLAEEVVKHTLDALIYDPGPRQTLNEDEWRIRKPADIINLSVADIAMGSGAFLVAADRYLANRLIESLTLHGATDQDDPALQTLHRITQQHEQSHATADTDTDEAALTARRLIATRVLYGADINPMAVEMAKLSLWLATAAKDHPFGFLDHHLVAGDSLLGLTDVKQLEYIHPDPRQGERLRTTTWLSQIPWTIQSTLQEALGQREALERIRVQDLRDVEQQQAILNAVQQQLRDLTTIANATTAETFRAAQNNNRNLDADLATVADYAETVLSPASTPEERDTARSWLLEVTRRMNDARPPGGFERNPVQWVLRFPEVFQKADRPGFDAILGNPPYLGGKKITPALGFDYRAFLVEDIGSGRRGNADLVIYFLLNAARLSQHTVGLLTTNTAAQGDSREIGLEYLTEIAKWRLVRAVRSAKWPSKSANLQFSAIYLDRDATNGSPAVLDGAPVRRIGPDLRVASRVTGSPHRLRASQNMAFQGSVVLGMGFVLTHSEADEMVAADPKNAEVIFPYLNGRDLNDSPDQRASRRIINFFDWTEEHAQRYALPFRHVAQRVRPERATKDAKKYPKMVNEWWRYWNERPGLYAALAGLDQAIAITNVSNVVQPTLVPTEQVFSHSLTVFASESEAFFGVLASAVHGEWVRRHAGGLRTDVRYAVDVFESFPLPQNVESLALAGSAVAEARRKVQMGRSIGLTATYNLVNDSATVDDLVGNLRKAHMALDLAVLIAYGWSDLEPDHGFYETEQGERFTMNPAVTFEVLERLLRLNKDRYEAEVAAGLHGKQGSPSRRKRNKPVSQAGGDGDATLFD